MSCVDSLIPACMFCNSLNHSLFWLVACVLLSSTTGASSSISSHLVSSNSKWFPGYMKRASSNSSIVSSWYRAARAMFSGTGGGVEGGEEMGFACCVLACSVSRSGLTFSLCLPIFPFVIYLSLPFIPYQLPLRHKPLPFVLSSCTLLITRTCILG